jgi:NTP pyrophosphatase (non-canonical NTP hydrolase)
MNSTNMKVEELPIIYGPMMEVLDVKLAKGLIFQIINKTNELVQSIYAGALHEDLFIAVMRDLLNFSKTFRFCLMVAVEAKQRINQQKYPPKVNQGIIVDYKLVSSVTGIDKNTASDVLSNLTKLHSMESMTTKWMDSFLVQSKGFVKERKWCEYDKPRMLCLAMMEEVGELCGVLKFANEKDGEVSCCVYSDMVSEICDIFIYFCRLSDVCGFFEIIKKEVAD